MTRVFEFKYEPSHGYGSGVMLIAANTKETAILRAEFEGKFWVFDEEITMLKYDADFKDSDASVIIQSSYSE